MGDINCHCHAEQSNVITSLQTLTPNMAEKPKQRSHKKTKSRVNSIISPRQIIGLHSKTNSTTNINFNASYSTKTHSMKVIKVEDSGDANYDICRNSRKYILEVEYNGEKYEAVMGNEVMRLGAVTERTGKYDIEMVVRKQYQAFGVCCRLNQIANTISIKDNGTGLGVFQFIKQDKILQISTNQHHSTPYIVLEIDVGKFVLIKRKPAYHLHKPSITYSLISNNKQLHKIPKSLPSLFDAGEDYQQYQNTHNKMGHNSSVEQGQVEVIENKVELQMIDNKIRIKPLAPSGLFRYLAEYHELSQGQVLRCGVSLFEVQVEENENIVFRLSPR